MGSGIRRLVVARFISEAGATAALFVGIWGKATFDLHVSPRQMSLAVALWGIGSVCGGLIGGVLVDRLDPRRVLILAEIVAVPAALALAVPDSYGWFIAVLAAASLSGAVIVTAVISFPPYLTAEEAKLSRFNAAIEAGGSIALVAGPAVGGVLAKAVGIDWVFVFDAATSVAALTLLSGLRVRSLAKDPAGVGVRGLGRSLRFAYAHKGARLCFLVAGLIWLSFGAFASLEAIFYREVLHADASALGFMMSLFGFGLLAGSVAFDRMAKHVVTARVLVGLTIVLGLAEALYVATDDWAVVIAGNVVWGIVTGAAFPLVRTLMHRLTPETMVGRMMGALVTHGRAAQMLPLTFIGSLAVAAGVQQTLVGTGLVLAVLALLTLPAAVSLDRETPPAPAAGIELTGVAALDPASGDLR